MSEDRLAPIAELVSALVACDSTNPSLVPGGAGESAVARLVAQQLERSGLEIELWEQAPGRLGVLGVLRGSGGGRSLLLCSHLDVVGSDPAGFDPVIVDGRLHGRGALDMKGGLAAALLAVTALNEQAGSLAGDVLVAGVIDEEWRSAGALDLIARLERTGRSVAGAILPEPTGLDVVVEHGGFAWWELTSAGVEAAGDDPQHGVDAIALAGRALSGILELDAELARGPAKPYGRPCVHAATAAGGRQLSAYPDSCTIGIERCTIPGETAAQAREQLQAVLDRCAAADPRADYTLRVIVERDAIVLDRDEPIVTALAAVAERELGSQSRVRGDMGWLDSGILTEAGIPCVAFGPAGEGEHTDHEWLELASVESCAAIIAEAARGFCGAPA
ncbi:MAG: M20/M25/M40 family metallo-hydrolase [Acidobacteriota bacterium]|nr:M20/M25/M40 family metallo-hydrolase [Acidobacteriota bacterium]